MSLRGRTLLVALILGVGASSIAWAGPFDQVPASDRAYEDCAYLAERGLVAPPPGKAFTPSQPFTRADFALALLPLSGALAGANGSPDGASGGSERLSDLLAALPPEEARQVVVRAAGLITRFRPELNLMDEDVDAALAEAKRLAESPPAVRPRSRMAAAGSPQMSDANSEGAAGLRYRVSGAELGLTYSRISPDRTPLAYLPTWTLARAVQPPATTRLAPGSAPAEYGSRDLSLSSLRGSVEYDLTRSLSLSLAYEALLHEGYGATLLDETSLKTVGLGYRLSPSTSVRLRYHLIDYRDRLATPARERDELAETELVIRF